MFIIINTVFFANVNLEAVASLCDKYSHVHMFFVHIGIIL